MPFRRSHFSKDEKYGIMYQLGKGVAVMIRLAVLLVIFLGVYLTPVKLSAGMMLQSVDVTISSACGSKFVSEVDGKRALFSNVRLKHTPITDCICNKHLGFSREKPANFLLLHNLLVGSQVHFLTDLYSRWFGLIDNHRRGRDSVSYFDKRHTIVAPNIHCRCLPEVFADNHAVKYDPVAFPNHPYRKLIPDHECSSAQSYFPSFIQLISLQVQSPNQETNSQNSNDDLKKGQYDEMIGSPPHSFLSSDVSFLPGKFRRTKAFIISISLLASIAALRICLFFSCKKYLRVSITLLLGASFLMFFC